MQVESLKWLISLGLLNDPQVKNHIILNIYSVDPTIIDVQLLMDTDKQKLLVYTDIKTRFWTRKATVDSIIDNITLRLNEMLTDYKVRVINDLDLFEKAIKIATNK